MHVVHLWRAFGNYAETGLELQRKYGDIVRVSLPKRGVYFFRPRHIRHVLRTAALNFPKSNDYDALRPLLGNGIFVSEGELWTRQRKLLAPEFREAIVGRYLPFMIESAERLFAEWETRIDEGPIDFTVDTMRLTLWIIGRTMFKSDFAEEAEIIGQSLEQCLAHATTQMLTGGLYKSWLPTPGNFAARRAERRLNDVLMAIIKRGREGDLGTIDVLSRMIRAKDQETGHQMSDEQLLDETKSLVLAGHETTSLALSWGFYLLARHPEQADRLAAEATAVLSDRTPRAEDMARLQFSRMVFLESMRLHPPVPTVSRSVVTPESIDGVTVRPGEMIFVAPYTTHRHPEYWAAPERFDPERFSVGRIDQIEPYSYLPFLVGRRACLGEHFAMLEGVLLFAMIARRYRLSLVSDGPVQSRPISTLRFRRPLIMRVERRT